LPLPLQKRRTNGRQTAARGPESEVSEWGPTARRLIGAVTLLAGMAPMMGAAAQSPPAGPAARAIAAAASNAADDKTAAPASDETQSPSAREKAHLARLDKAIAPLHAYQVSKPDAAKLRDAIQALVGDKVDKAAELRAGVTDPLGRKLIDWYRLRRGDGTAAEYASFLAENPGWPSEEILRTRMEQVLFAEGGDSAVISRYFKDHEPQSAAGLAVLASIHLAHGETEKAKALASKVWREHDLPGDLEHGFLARFGSLLTPEDHKWRLDRLLVDDIRWKERRNQKAALAKRVIPLLSKPEQRKARARLAVFLRTQVPKAQLKAAPGTKVTDWGLVFHRVQQLRRKEKLDEAAKLILSAPTDPDVVVNLDDWWNERQKLAYDALKANKPKLAYQLVHEAGPLSVNPLNEQSFMAGWIALRYLKDVDAAVRHFAAYSKTADGPLSRAKSNYWLGRAFEAKGDQDKAKEAYRAAAREYDTFHGLLAMQKLDPGRRRITISPPEGPSREEIAELNGMDAAKAAALAYAAGLNRPVTRIFLRHLATLKDSEGWAAMVAHLAHDMDDTQTAVRIGKAAIANGHNLVYYAYPVHALPDYKPLRPPPETAFLLGLARQETEFNTDIVSGAGARGILQVMKGTANHVCREYKIKCNHTRLTSDASYNTMIASAYVADRMADFSGSYVLGLTSYNAGPGRTRQWIREFGDPRKAGVDPIDWIERIPIEETRRYVAKVLSNIQIYRARLGEEATALRLDEDLSRAREAELTPKKHDSGQATAKSGD
jgi:peptidoglycan lytic transglycosylase